MSLKIITLPTNAGQITAALSSPQAAFVRKTNLNPDWKVAKLAVIFSFRGLGTDDAPPVAETLGPSGGEPTKYHIGLSNGLGNPGAGAAKFIGVSSHRGYDIKLFDYLGVWRINYSAGQQTTRLYPLVTNAQDLESKTGYDVPAGAGTPTGPTNHAFGVAISFSRSGSSMTIGASGLQSITMPTQQHVGSNLQTLLASATTANVVFTGKWWTDGTPTECTHLYIHFPWAANRLVIHGYQVVRLT